MNEGEFIWAECTFVDEGCEHDDFYATEQGAKASAVKRFKAYNSHPASQWDTAVTQWRGDDDGDKRLWSMRIREYVNYEPANCTARMEATSFYVTKIGLGP